MAKQSDFLEESSVDDSRLFFDQTEIRPVAAANPMIQALPYLSYWLIMIFSVSATLWLSQAEIIGDAAWIIMAQANMLLILGFENIIPKRRNIGVFLDRQSWNDIAHMLAYKIIVRPLGWIITIILVTSISQNGDPAFDIWPKDLPFFVQFLILLTLFDLAGYFFHRVLHKFDSTFAFHALHHDTNQLHVLKSNRLHFGESMLNFIIMTPMLMLFGAPEDVVVWLGMWEVFDGNLAHSNVDQRFPRWFHYVVRTADLHRIHHSVVDKEQQSNFSVVPLWDVVFGTYRHPSDCDPQQTGIAGNPVPKSIGKQLLFPFRALRSPSIMAGEGSDR